MMISPKFAITAIGIAAVSAAALLFNFRETGEEVGNAASVKPVQPPMALTSPSEGVPPSPQSGIAATGVAREDSLLLLELAKSTNYKKVFEDGKASPEKGGLYAAGLVNQRCSDVRNLLAQGRQIDDSKSHSDAYKIQAATERLSIICGGMIDDDVDFQKGYIAHLRNVNRRADPIMRLKDDYTKAFAAGDMSSVAEGIRQALKLSAPEVFQNLTMPVKDGAYYFDGRSYSFGADGDARILEGGKLLAVCEIWGQCGSATDYYLLRACASQGICESTYSALVAAQLTPKQLEDARAIAKKMAGAAATSDITPFVPPR